MPPVSAVEFTGLFWETLERVRSSGQYDAVRRSLDHFVARKAVDRGPVNARDKPFRSVLSLAGVWHCALLRSYDCVLFYRYSGDVLVLAMLGSHEDYPFAGKHKGKSAGLAGRINRAVAGGHVPSPNWRNLNWRRPSDLVGNRELRELSLGSLQAISAELVAEAQTGALFRSIHGVDVLSTDAGTLDAWIAEVEAAHSEVLAAISSRPLTSDGWQEKVGRAHAMAA